MTFKLSRRSLSRLDGVHLDLVSVVTAAIHITKVDFGVHTGLRTLEEQRELVRKRASRTMRSRHLTGHAVDLIAYVGPRVSWELALYCEIARAMRDAANKLEIPLEWGAVWDRRLNNLSDDLDGEIEAYAARYRARGKKKGPLIDGPHFQLPKRLYPA